MSLDAQARACASQEISFHGFDLHTNYDLASKLELLLVDKEIWYLTKRSLITCDFKKNRFYQSLLKLPGAFKLQSLY